MEPRTPLDEAREYLERVTRLNTRYRDGTVRVNVPAALRKFDVPLAELVAECLPASHRALEAADEGLFYSLPVAFDPGESVGCYLATADRDERGEPYRFLDMGALIATHAFGENDPGIVAAVLRDLPSAVERYAHSEYQTVLSLRTKAALNAIAPKGTPRHFVVNTGAEAVENAIKAVLLNRVRTAGEKDGGFIISFDGAFHGRTLGALAVTHRKKARMGFPTFDWPQASFPTDDPASPAQTARREEKSLRQIWDLLVSGRLPKESFRRELEQIDAFLAAPGDVAGFVEKQRAEIPPEIFRRARRVAAVLIEPIQGEGGVRMATPRFFRRLRLLTRIYDVPLVFDEVQTGWCATGRLWAHEQFDLPAPPDVVTWAKKAQNGILFVSEELATFFQEEKKFNTTWEGDSVGMIRLCALLERPNVLALVHRTGAVARESLDLLAKEYPELLQNVRGAGVMLGFDVVRTDWRDVLRDRAFRRGLILLPAGERTLRFYPRYDTTPAAIEEAIGILRSAVGDILMARPEPVLTGPRLRVGEHEVPLECVEAIDLDPRAFGELHGQIMEVEIARYGNASQYPPDVLKAGRRPLLQYPEEALETTLGNARSAGVALRDAVSGRIIAYAVGSPLENYDEVGVRDDPHFGENNTFYLQAAATLPSVLNEAEIQNRLLEELRKKILSLGFERISTLIEERIHKAAPAWFRDVAPLRVVDDYLRSGLRFVYVQAELVPAPGGGERT